MLHALSQVRCQQCRQTAHHRARRRRCLISRAWPCLLVPAPEEARHSIAYREEVLRWDVEAITAAHNRLLQRRPALVDILGGCGLSRHFKEAAPPGGDEGSGSRRTGFAALSQIRRGYTVNRREFWEVGGGARAVSAWRPPMHVCACLTRRSLLTTTSSTPTTTPFCPSPCLSSTCLRPRLNPTQCVARGVAPCVRGVLWLIDTCSQIPALQVFSVLILLCKSPQHDQVGALFDLFCWGQSDLEQVPSPRAGCAGESQLSHSGGVFGRQAELTALVGTVSTGFAKFGVTNAPLSAAGVKAVAASVFERYARDTPNFECVCATHRSVVWSVRT